MSSSDLQSKIKTLLTADPHMKVAALLEHVHVDFPEATKPHIKRLRQRIRKGMPEQITKPVPAAEEKQKAKVGSESTSKDGIKRASASGTDVEKEFSLLGKIQLNVTLFICLIFC